MHTFTTAWIIRLIVEYPATADPAVYSRLTRELGMRFSRRADLLSAELRNYKFNSRYFAELPLCNYPIVRKFLLRHGIYQHIRDAARDIGVLGGTMMAEYRHRYAAIRRWPSQSTWLVGCVAESLAELDRSDAARSVVMNLHGPLSFIVCTACHPVQCPADFTAAAANTENTTNTDDCGAQMYSSWVAWATGILPVWQNSRGDEYAIKVAQLTTEYSRLGDVDAAHCKALGKIAHSIRDARTNTSLRRALAVCVAAYMPPILALAYLAAYIM
jgi:hypothetical protein